MFDAYTAMIPKADGDATPLGQRPLSVLPVVYRIWASARMIQLELEAWFRSWDPGSVEAWRTTALDIKRSFLVLLSRMCTCLWVTSLSPLIRLTVVSLIGFLSCPGLGQPWTRDGGIPQGCPLSMMFLVAFYLPWCRYLGAQDGV